MSKLRTIVAVYADLSELYRNPAILAQFDAAGAYLAQDDSFVSTNYDVVKLAMQNTVLRLFGDEPGTD